MLQEEDPLTFFLIDDELYVESPEVRGPFRVPSSPFAGSTVESVTFAATANSIAAPVFKFGRMFRRPELPEFRPREEGLIKLGSDMGEEEEVDNDPNLPAGYVYLGQFIDHDLTFNAMTNRLPLGIGSLQEEKSLRSPSFDLDSLYGLDPAEFKQTELGSKVYDADGITLRVGTTIEDDDVPKLGVFQNDLPRKGAAEKDEAAAVVDPRNDENLVVAQTHLTFIKFHNAMVRKLSKEFEGQDLFDNARAEVVRHYQYIVLNDYLPRIIDPVVLNKVLDKGCEYLHFDKEVTMPFEFALAGFRFGHAQVSNTYEWNRFFQTPHFYPASLDNLFMFTGFREMNMLNRLRLPSSWIIDWTRFYDFQPQHEVSNNSPSNRARRIVPSLVNGMIHLRPFMTDKEKLMAVLPVRNLLRGRFLGLPAGQCVARRIGVTELTADEIKDKATERRRSILEEYGFDRLTPLWYYILKEAELEGTRLGPVGSLIVAETFVELMRRSTISILPPVKGRPNWKPDRFPVHSMPDLLVFVERTLGEHINPLKN